MNIVKLYDLRQDVSSLQHNKELNTVVNRILRMQKK